MGLSCSCDLDYNFEPGDYCWDISVMDYSILDASRRKRCWSCNDLIDIGATVIKFRRWKIPESGLECWIYGEDGEVPLAPKYHCEACADQFFNLDALGFCGSATENQFDLLAEYHGMQEVLSGRNQEEER